MTSELSEDVVLQITSPHILPAEGAGGGRGGGSGAAELGRRLLAAARAGHTALVLELMGKGAPFTTDWLGTSALHHAAAGAHLDTCGVLLRAGVSRDARTKVERTPLHLAAHAGHAAAAALLLRHGAAVDPRDMLRMTPLHWAAERGHAATVAALLRHGADPRARTKFGRTPLQLAELRGHAAAARVLRAPPSPSPPAPAAAAPPDAAEQRRALRSIEQEEPGERGAPEPERAPEPGPRAEGGRAEGARETAAQKALAAQLLRRHGIALLPRDEGSTVLNAIQSGRCVVLSDAGKLMLKESVPAAAPGGGAGPGTEPAGQPGQAGGQPGQAAGQTVQAAGQTVQAAGQTGQGKGQVVVTATAVRSPPRAGVKIFALNNNNLVAMPSPPSAAAPAPAPLKLAPHDMQIKLVKVRPQSRGASKAKHRLAPLPPAAAPGGRPAVKIIMHKASFDKIVAGSGKAESEPAAVEAGAGEEAGAGAEAGALAEARAAARRLQAEVERLKARLALYEPV